VRCESVKDSWTVDPSTLGYVNLIESFASWTVRNKPRHDLIREKDSHGFYVPLRNINFSITGAETRGATWPYVGPVTIVRPTRASIDLLAGASDEVVLRQAPTSFI
jgi:hypothetical protein